jgi:hypothetical protein
LFRILLELLCCKKVVLLCVISFVANGHGGKVFIWFLVLQRVRLIFQDMPRIMA